ncbi:transcription factor IIIB 60 kDa subunit-like [Macadamia integrifolia]|uniref:transcription factor IIIB 60 kDa subunit-like n=1 Tax=Macadamia integrifolia TaxID=60698 RepID=UPI001C4E5B24|nr:transcription factor IIIB 60 kDa subunit-like [Macadamia integrifolia]
MSGMTELLCEHKGRGDAHFAHGLCKLCYKDFVELSGGLEGGSEPPAFQRAERERMEKTSAEGVRESSPGATPCHRDNGQKQFEKGEESVRENHPDVIENERMHSGAAAEHHFVYQDGSSQSKGNEDMDNVAGDESESLSDIDDVEVDGYLHNEEEKHYKKIIWEEMNREYLEEQAAKEAAVAAAKEFQESDLQNCSEELLNARQLAAAAAAAVEKSKKERKQKRAANAKNGTPAQTAAEATREMLTKKRLSSKINYEVLEKLFDDSTAPEKSKKKRVESDDENVDDGQQISEESGEKEVVSDVVDNNDDFREDDYEEGDGDGLYYGNEEDGYGYDDEY